MEIRIRGMLGGDFAGVKVDSFLPWLLQRGFWFGAEQQREGEESDSFINRRAVLCIR